MPHPHEQKPRDRSFGTLEQAGGIDRVQAEERTIADLPPEIVAESRIDPDAVTRWNALAEEYADTASPAFTRPVDFGNRDAESDRLLLRGDLAATIRGALFIVEELLNANIDVQNAPYDPVRRNQYSNINTELAAAYAGRPHNRNKSVFLSPSDRRAIHLALDTAEYVTSESRGQLADLFGLNVDSATRNQLNDAYEVIPEPDPAEQAVSDVFTLSREVMFSDVNPVHRNIHRDRTEIGATLTVDDEYVESIDEEVTAILAHLSGDCSYEQLYSALVDAVKLLVWLADHTEGEPQVEVGLARLTIEYVLETGQNRGFADEVDRYRISFATDRLTEPVRLGLEMAATRAEDVVKMIGWSAIRYEESLTERQRFEHATTEEFPAITRELHLSHQRDAAYYQEILREVKGKKPATKLPEREVRRIQEAPDAYEETVETLRENIRNTRDDDTDLTKPELASRDQTSLPWGNRVVPYKDEDYVDGTTIKRDPEFEQKFVNFAQEMGHGRSFKFGRDQRPGEYFALTPEHQRKFYDNTPQEFMAWMIRRGDTTRLELVTEYGFDDDQVPDDVEV